ncbi:MAG: protein disulfide oxidoreductase [Pseudomonadota bacterium]
MTRPRRPILRRVRILLIYLVIFGLMMTAISMWRTRDAPDGPAPPIHGETLAGEAFELAELRGEPVLVHFWATWCPICELEAPTIDALAEDHRVITVAAWSGDRESVADHVEEEGITAPVLVDDPGHFADAYGVQAVPTTFVVAPDGTVSAATSGYTTGIGLRLRLWWAGLGG